MPCGVGGVPTGAGLVDGGVDQGPWLQERVGGGVGARKSCRVTSEACLIKPQPQTQTRTLNPRPYTLNPKPCAQKRKLENLSPKLENLSFEC